MLDAIEREVCGHPHGAGLSLCDSLRATQSTCGAVFLIGERVRHRIVDRAAQRVLLHLEKHGPSALNRLVEVAGCERQQGLRLVERLLSAGFIAEQLQSPEQRVADLREQRPEAGTLPEAVRMLGPVSTATALREVLLSGLARAQVAEHTGGATLWVVADLLQPDFDVAIRAQLAAGQAVIPFKPFGERALLGPRLRAHLRQPSESCASAVHNQCWHQHWQDACWTCLRQRLLHNRPVERWLLEDGCSWQQCLQRPWSSPERLAAALDWLRERLATRDFAAPGAPAAQLWEWEPNGGVSRPRQAPRLPQCPDCGDAKLWRARAAAPPQLLPRERAGVADGGYRIMSAAQTYARLAHHVDDMVGVVASLGRLASKDGPLRPVFAANHFVTPPRGPLVAQARFEQISVGKGRTAAQARASALCEALERVAARVRGDEPRQRACYRAVKDSAVHPEELLLFSDAQYRNGTPAPLRKRLLATPRSQQVPQRLIDTQPIDWTPAWNIATGARCLVPFDYVYAGGAPAPGERVCAWDSNGCAAGNCLEEAVLQGLLELIERDATAIWWYNRIRRPAVDLAGLGDPYVTGVVQTYAALGHQVWALDLTHDLGVPVVVALAKKPSSDRYAMGLGCHVDGLLAVQRAMTELHQVFDPEERHDPLVTEAELPDECFLYPVSDEPARLFPRAGRVGDTQVACILRAVEGCVARLAAAGLSVWVADYTRPDLSLTTVRVIAPGLRHFWPRLAPGRLFDVPVAMGWLVEAKCELEINPMPLLM